MTKTEELYISSYRLTTISGDIVVDGLSALEMIARLRNKGRSATHHQRVVACLFGVALDFPIRADKWLEWAMTIKDFDRHGNFGKDFDAEQE